MTKSDAVKFFGSQAELASALGITQPSVAEWPEQVPKLRQIQLERITKGKLQADPECYMPAKAQAA